MEFRFLYPPRCLRLSRCYATGASFVPPNSAREVFPVTSRDKPESPSFFTGRAKYYDSVLALQSTLSISRRRLEQASLLPPPASVVATFSKLRPKWKSEEELSELLTARVRTGQYHKLLVLLNELLRMRTIARLAGEWDVDNDISEMLKVFDKRSGVEEPEAVRKRWNDLDEYGRSYALGRRKESSARVWMIPTDASLPTAAPVTVRASSSAEEVSGEVNSSSFAEMDSEMSGLESSEDALDDSESASDDVLDQSELLSENAALDEFSESNSSNLLEMTRRRDFLVSTVLINNRPLGEYFSHVTDREVVVRPLRLTGLLGAFNVFVLTRGGGTTGQAGATAVGIARCIMSHAPQMQSVLNKAGLLHRDPRMVERKKTGLAKARKRYTWVKR